VWTTDEEEEEEREEREEEGSCFRRRRRSTTHCLRFSHGNLLNVKCKYIMIKSCILAPAWD